MAPVELARGLLAAVMVALLFSPPVTSLLELSLYALMLGSRELRGRFTRAVREPLGAMALAFWAVVALGVLYSVAPWGESLGTWWSWRRLLLLVIALALFDDRRWKLRLVWILVCVAAIVALASYVGALFELSVRHYPAGIVLRSHALQGMVFAVAAFAAALLLKHEELSRPARLLVAAVAMLLVLNVAFITTGRSGHAVVAILAAACAFGWLPASIGRAKRAAWAVGAVVLALAVLASSPIVRQRVVLGLSELQQPAPPGAIVSSMGERRIYTRNTLSLIAERPVIGYGTGSFKAAYSRVVEGRTGLEGIKAHDPHNQYLNVAAQHGLVGLAVFLALLGSSLRQRSSAPYRLLGLGVLAAWCATSLFSSHFSTFAEGRFIWLWLGVCLARE